MEEEEELVCDPEKIVPLLLEAGADLTIKDNGGQTARDLAEVEGWDSIVAILDAWQKENR
jgi:ankyrin repeat protein